jgi:hypothetical protein
MLIDNHDLLKDKSDVLKCIRCLESDTNLVVDNFKEYAGIKTIKYIDKSYLFHKVYYAPVCVPCIIQLLNRKKITNYVA